MNIVVCVKKILDPEIPADKFKVKMDKVVPPEGIPMVMNPYDAQAVEAALMLRETYGGKVTAITAGSPDAQDIIRRALAMGADEGIVLSDESFNDLDDMTTSHLLAQAIRKIGDIDLILCGRESADWNKGLVGPLIAEVLKLPVITLVKSIELLNDKTVKVERVISDGYQVFEISLPAVVTISNEVGLPRIPTGMGIIKAARMQVPIWSRNELDADAFPAENNMMEPELLSLTIPDRTKNCEMVEGKNPEEIGVKMVAKLKGAGLI